MLDLTKPMQTREGLPARLIYDKLDHEYGPLVFAVMNEHGIERIGYRDAEGRYPEALRGGLATSPWDIINSPTPDNMVIVEVRNGMVDVTQVPDGVVVKVMDYDVDTTDADNPDLIVDERDTPCTAQLFGPAGLYPVWPFAS